MILLQIAGRVGNDAESKKVNNQYCISFSVAHGSKYRDAQGNTQEHTTWVKCALWKDKDNISQHIKKGDVVFCSGFPKSNAWVDQDRKVRHNLEMNVQSFEFIHSKKSEAQAPTPSTPEASATQTSNDSFNWNS